VILSYQTAFIPNVDEPDAGNVELKEERGCRFSTKGF